MLEQLDLFATFSEERVYTAVPEETPATVIAVAERKLVPPQVLLQEDEPPVDVKPREVIREEAEKIAKGIEPVILIDLPASEETEEIKVEDTVPAIRPISDIFLEIRPEEPEKTKSTRGRKSIREMSAEADSPEVPEDEVLYSKQYYGIGEVAAMFKVNTSLLRYWESEFDILKPRKNGKGDRFFRPDDIKNLQIIHHLLRQKKYTIEGAKDHLKNNKKSKEKFEMIRQLEQLKRFLSEMKTGLALS